MEISFHDRYKTPKLKMYNHATGTDMHRCKQLWGILADTGAHTLTQRVFPREIREWGYFRTMCRLALPFSEQIQTVLQKTTLVRSCFLIETSSLCQIPEMLQPHNQCFSSYRKLLVTAMCLPAMWKGWLGPRSPIVGSSFISPESWL